MAEIQKREYVPMSRKEKDRLVEQGEQRLGKHNFFAPSIIEVTPTGQTFSAMIHMMSETIGLPINSVTDRLFWEAIEDLKEKSQAKN